MGISPRVALWLNSLGHNAIHISENNLHKLSDDLIIEKAITENRVVLTADMDFGQLLALDSYGKVSIIQFRVSNFKSDYLISKMELVFEEFKDRLNDNFIITVEDNRIRFRLLPILPR
jgi:predicted nuclease of predicted toxin-antitoxin system